MSVYIVGGGRVLSGELRVGGAKNSALKILAAALMHNGVSVIHDCPLISDVFVTIEILESLGCVVDMRGHTVTVDASAVAGCHVPARLANRMRSSIILLGPLMGRFGCADVAMPGGCTLGDRKIDMHLDALGAMGASYTFDGERLLFQSNGLRGADIRFPSVSVGATENAMLAAVLADGVTVIRGAAQEPEIADIAAFLNAMGADVSGAGTSTVTIRGVRRLRDAEHTVVPDRIVAGTYLAAAAITGGEITLTNVRASDLAPITDVLERMGCRVTVRGAAVTLTAPHAIRPIGRLATSPHPGFPTDMQSQIVSCLTLAQGTSEVCETIFADRFKHATELIKMGADIEIEGGACRVRGVRRLRGMAVAGTELRGGAALIIAGLAAEGTTYVSGGEFVERGYEDIAGDLRSLGADARVE
jgi:UDP-N-acetylglucosamine 1-carboxyvinyltransferase